MSTQKSRKEYVSHSVLNDRYPHGRVEKITENGVWLEGKGQWYHFNTHFMANQVLPKPGAYVVLTEDENHRITHIAVQHELQQPPEDAQWNETEALAAIVAMEHTAEQPNSEPEIPRNIEELVGYRMRTDALALAIQLLNLEAHYGIDRDDAFRVAQEVIRWIQG